MEIAWHGNANGRPWYGLKRNSIGMETWHGNGMPCMDWQNGMERHGNGVEIKMTWKWHAMEWIGKALQCNCNGMAWKGMEMTWHQQVCGIGFGRLFVSLCSITQKLGRNVK
jgi:hypothetical protein